MQRDEAIAILARRDLDALTDEQRVARLDAMLLTDSTSHPRWQTVPRSVRMEYKLGWLVGPLTRRRYDPLLLLTLGDGHRFDCNAWLAEAVGAQAITGDEPDALACPCCGRRTLDSRGEWDICPVCWWEDSGQDGETADHPSSCNGGTSLTSARHSALVHGIFHPGRQDLAALAHPAERYLIGRTFALTEDGRGVREPASGWEGYPRTQAT